MIRFAQPIAFLLLLLVPPIVWMMWRAGPRATPKMMFSSIRLIGRQRGSLKLTLRPLPKILFLAALLLIIVALARPQNPWQEHTRRIEGIDIMMVLDVSESMAALDFDPNRLEVSKKVVKEFIGGRRNDQIGVVLFGKETFALAPLTHDYDALRTFIDRIDFDLVDGSATAVGMGLANGVNKLKDSRAISKVIILLTDGENNYGEIDPITAGRIAAELGVRVYTIGVGSQGIVQIPVELRDGRRILQAFRSNIDTRTLSRVAEMTGGKFFEADDADKLAAIYAQIDKLERTEFEVNETNYYDELAHYLIVPALALLGLALLLDHTWLWSFP